MNISQYAAEKLNCFKDTPAETIGCLQTMEIRDLLDLQNDSFFSPVTAVIDGELLPKNLFELMLDGDINVEEVIIGVNQDEGLLYSGALAVNETLYDEYFGNWDVYGPGSLFGKRHEGSMTDITEQDIQQSFEVLEYYTGKTDNLNSDDFLSVTKMLTDTFWYASHTFAEMLNNKGVTVFQYLFSYKGKIYSTNHLINYSYTAGQYSYMDYFDVDSSQYGVAHADELYFFWNPVFLDNLTLNIVSLKTF